MSPIDVNDMHVVDNQSEGRIERSKYMTIEEYIVNRVQELEEKNKLLEKRVNELVSENDKLADTIREIADITQPHLSKDGEFIMFDSIWSREKQFKRFCEIFGLETDSNA